MTKTKEPPERQTQGVTPDYEFHYLPVDYITPSPFNPRRSWDNGDLDELVESIKEKGVLQPVTVRLKPDTDKHEIVFGHRRHKAAQLAGLKRIPAMICSFDDRQVMEAQLVENLQRSSLHELDEAEGYRRLMNEAGYRVEDIQQKIGRSRSYVYGRLKLLDLIEDAKEAFIRKEIETAHAIMMARLTPAQQQKALGYVIDSGWRPDPDNPDGDLVEYKFPKNVRQLQTWIHENFHLDLTGVPWLLDDAELVDAAGPCTTCPKRSGANPDLFGDDIKKPDVCTDPACFKRKHTAHIDSALKMAEEQAKKKPHKLSTQYWTDVKGAYNSNHWSKVKRGTPGAEVGVIVEGDDVGKILHVHVTKPKRETRADKGKSHTRRVDEKEQARLERKVKILQEVRLLTYQQVEQKIIESGLDRVDKHYLAVTLLHGFFGTEHFEQVFGYDFDERYESEDEATQYSNLLTAAPPELARIAIFKALRCDLGVSVADIPEEGTTEADYEPVFLNILAKQYGIDVDEIARRVEADYPEPVEEEVNG